MQALRNSVYLVVAAASVAMATCQPTDRFTEAPATGVSQVTPQIAQLPFQWIGGSDQSIRPPEGSRSGQRPAQ